MKTNRLLLALPLALAVTACAADSGQLPSSDAPGGGKGDIAGEPSRGAPTFECSWTLPTTLPDSSEALAESIASGRPVSIDDASSLSVLEAQQVIAAMQHLEFIGSYGSLGEAFDAADDDELELIELELEQQDDLLVADWVRLYAGDTEVGVLFADGTTDVIGEVSDGDVMGCQPSAD